MSCCLSKLNVCPPSPALSCAPCAVHVSSFVCLSLCVRRRCVQVFASSRCFFPRPRDVCVTLRCVWFEFNQASLLRSISRACRSSLCFELNSFARSYGSNSVRKSRDSPTPSKCTRAALRCDTQNEHEVTITTPQLRWLCSICSPTPHCRSTQTRAQNPQLRFAIARSKQSSDRLQRSHHHAHSQWLSLDRLALIAVPCRPRADSQYNRAVSR